MDKDLPIEIVVKITAMMPFPEIFKAMLLSRSWCAIFKTLSKIRDEDQHHLAALFQKQVRQWSNSWAIFSPVCTIDVARPVGFNQAQRKWQRIPSLHLPFFTETEEESLWNTKHLRGTFLPSEKINLHLEGPFLYGIRERPENSFRISVRNILNGEWKALQLEFPREIRISVQYMKLVIDSSAETYKVILVCLRRDSVAMSQGNICGTYSTCVYDSKSNAWTRTNYGNSFLGAARPSNFVYLNGICYACFYFQYLPFLLGFNVEERTVKVVRCREIIDDEDRLRFDDVKLVGFDGNLIMAVLNFPEEAVYILKVDLASRRASQVADCHLDDMLDVIQTHEKITSLFCDVDNCLFLEISSIFQSQGQMVVYNRLKDEWTFYVIETPAYLWTNSRFQPGLNPFMAV